MSQNTSPKKKKMPAKSKVRKDLSAASVEQLFATVERSTRQSLPVYLKDETYIPLFNALLRGECTTEMFLSLATKKAYHGTFANMCAEHPNCKLPIMFQAKGFAIRKSGATWGLKRGLAFQEGKKVVLLWPGLNILMRPAEEKFYASELTIEPMLADTRRWPDWAITVFFWHKTSPNNFTQHTGGVTSTDLFHITSSKSARLKVSVADLKKINTNPSKSQIYQIKRRADVGPVDNEFSQEH